MVLVVGTCSHLDTFGTCIDINLIHRSLCNTEGISMVNNKYMMCDLETLDTTPHGVILSAGLLVFDLEGNTYQEYYQEYDVLDQLSQGRTVSPETVAWWRKTNQKEFNRLLMDGVGNHKLVADVANALYKEAGCKSIFQRGSMDVPMMETLGLDVPYWAVKDCRSFDILERMGKGNNHNALDDCKNQVLHIQSVYRRYNEDRSDK